MNGGRRGLFLDLDGTLADSIGALRGVYHAFLARHGATGTEEEFQRLNGPPLSTIVAELMSRHGLPGDHGALMRLYADMARDALTVVPPATGAAAVLARAADRGWKVAVVTSSTRAHTRAWLRQVGLEGAVDLVVGGDDVGCGKPDPEPYRTALARLGCDPAVSLALEDGVQGATAALAAGLPTFVLMRAVPPALAGHAGLRGRLDRFAAIAEFL